MISFDQVSKQFTLHRDRPRSFQELFVSTLRRERKPAKERYWVLNNVSFAIEQGDVVGIIGANGVGKSTILKLISRIIQPTSGTISVNGRIGALLELGAGFHPDLTGRENVYLNGSILGFTRAHMNRIFDDILDFSEIENFVDVPVKHYSSGMYMRLAFSIAIHMEPDILLVDEVLAVGDQAFQLRCLDRIHDMQRDGVTIVMVSHAMDTVRNMCTRALWLDDGMIQVEGDVDHVIDCYTAQVIAQDQKRILKTEQEEASGIQGMSIPSEGGDGKGGLETKLVEDKPAWRWGSWEAEIARVEILSGAGREQRTFKTGDPLIVRIHYVAHQPIQKPKFGLAIYHNNGFQISGPNNVFAGYEIDEIAGCGYVDYCVESLPLLQGTYLLTAAIHDYEGEHTYDHHHQQFTFRVRPGGVREQFGSFCIPATWRWSGEQTVHDAGAPRTAGAPTEVREQVG
ncbi:MAG: ABC transporter ATP-binding protein [Anaerolineae bacterium]|nr:ABC transporter ATP-binding protein [Anaerolineae bacterium]